MSKIKTDLTVGSVPRQLTKYAVPLVASSLLQAVYGIVDTIIAGHFIPGGGISGISNGSMVMNFFTQLAIGFTVGGNILISQYFGAKDEENQKKASGTLFTLCMAAGLLFTLICFFAAKPLLKLFGAPALDNAVVYMQTCAFGCIFIFGYNALSATLRGVGNSRLPMVFILIAAVMNVVLDYISVAIWGWGVFGAAIATVVSQIVCFLLALGYVLLHRKALGFQLPYLRIRLDKLKLIAKLGFPVSLQHTVGSISWLAVMVLINKHGVAVSDGNAVSNKIKELCQLFITAMTGAAGTMAAQNIGTGNYQRAAKVMKTCLVITLCIAVALIIVCEFFAEPLVRLFTDDPAAIGHAVRNLRIEIVAQIFYAAMFSLNVLAMGCGDTLFVMWNSFLNCIVVRLVLAITLEHFHGVLGVYIACSFAPSVSVPVGYWYYRRGKWRRSLTKRKEETV